MINPYIILGIVAVMFIIVLSCFFIDVSTGLEEDATIASNTNIDEVSLSSLSLEEDDEYEDADVLILDDLT